MANEGYTQYFDNAKPNRAHWFIIIILGLGGFADFFNVSGVIAGGSLSMEAAFHVGTSSYALIVALTNVFMLIGALVIGFFSDKLGRRKLFTIDLLVMFIFTFISIFSTNFTEFLVTRTIVSFVIGGDYATAFPLISEFAPKLRRGKFLMIFWLLTNIGELVGYITAWILDVNFGLSLTMIRLIIIVGIIPIILSLILRTIGLPESPRWLFKKGKFDELAKVIKDVTGNTVITDELNKKVLGPNNKQVKKMHEMGSIVFLAIIIAIPLFVVANSTGIMVYYYPVIFTFLHVNKIEAILFEAILFIPSVLIVSFSIYFLDKIGRFLTVSIGMILTIIGYLLIYLLHPSIVGLLLILLLLVPWIGLAEGPLIAVASEIFPTQSRSLFSGVQTASWRLGFVALSYTLPLLIVAVGVGGMYAIESIFLIIALIIMIIFFRPRIKIKNKSLEEIEQE